MTIFEILKDVIQEKKGNLHEDSEFHSQMNPYMLQRWVSMDSPQNAVLVNETSNKLWSIMSDDKEFVYKLYVSLINKKRYAKIAYIKKTKNGENEKHEEEIQKLARINGISTREVKSHIKTLEALGFDVNTSDGNNG